MATGNYDWKIKTFFFFNCVGIIGVGVFLFVAATWSQANKDNFAQIISSDPLIPTFAYGFYVAGIFFVVMGVSGARGVALLSKWFLGIFFILLTCFVLIEVVFGVVVLINYTSAIQQALRSMQDYVEIATTRMFTVAFWQSIQRNLGCCGVTGIRDWMVSNIRDPPPPCSEFEEVLGCEDALQQHILLISLILLFLIILELVLLAIGGFLMFQTIDISDIDADAEGDDADGE